MIARVSTALSAFMAAGLLAAACQPAGGNGGTAGSSGPGGGAGTSGAAGATGTGNNAGAAGSTGGSGAGGDAGSAGGRGGGAAGTSGAAGATGAAGTSGSAGNGGRGGGGTAGTTGTAGTGARGGTSAGTGGQGGSVGTGGMGGLTCTTPPPTGTSYTVDATGVTFTLSPGRMKVSVCKDDIIRVQYTSASSIPAKTSLSVSATWGTPTFCVTEAAGVLTITTARMKAKITESTGLVSYTDLSDTALTSEYSKSLAAATVEGTATNTVAAAFNSPANEALFGLGQQQDSVLNRKGTTLRMLNENTKIMIPVLVSNKGYGLLWDNYSITNFAGNVSSNTRYSFSSETGDLVDYYFFYGPTIDQVIANYRTTTGPAPMFPKWAYGLFQSKDHYQSSAELTAVQNGYRNNNIPVDVIVQDWQYWSPAVWGSHLMDAGRYPDPAGIVNQLHAAHIHTMISIWPLYQTRSNGVATVAGELDNYNALNAINALYPTGTSGGTYHFYDTFNADARTLVYKQSYDRLIGKYGWDSIWADNTEPQSYPEGVNVHAATTALGKGAFYINAYPLQHNKAVYEGWRKLGPNNKRVYILTRSGFAGLQRYAAGTWSGDINATQAVYVAQVPAGLSYAISGMPYWTTDIGGYFGTPSEELFTRWFQFGAFCPTFRIHGQAPKELYGSQWSAAGKANMLAIDNLRYRLMPYIYSLAWKITSAGYTMMRPLVFDFQNDTMVYGVKDQFMFGPALMVSPVTATGATSRSVYLPAGTWYDFWTGSTIMGGTTTTASAPLSQLPIHVRGGSILPMGPMIQYATQSADPLEIRVYAGADASFTIYEDEGDTYNYETGQYAQIPLTWNNAAKTLTIGARTGSYTGMLAMRTFNVVFVGANHGSGIAVTATPDQVVKYDGTQAVVTAP
jgi:alpha-D-xyloside xylohydrolase